MGLIKGGFLRLLQTALYFLIFCCAAIILGFYSYFLAVLADRDSMIPTWEKAVEGLSGAAVLYLIFATVLTCCLGGITVFALLAIILDVCFVGAMIAVAVLTRDGASSCTGYVHTPLGDGPATSQSAGFHNNNDNGDRVFTYQVSQRTACKYNTACFAVSIIAAFLFLITAAMQVALVRSHKKEKRYGPGPSNNYTSGYGSKRKFWQRKPKNNTTATRDAELGAGGLAAPTAAHDMRPSYETGTTMGNNAHLTQEKPLDQPVTGSHTGYYTQPTGTGVSNPYGYTNTNTTTTTSTNY